MHASTTPAQPGPAARSQAENLRILTFQPEYAADFKRLNAEWIEKDFVLEDHDLEMLDHPEAYVLQRGGQILLAEHQGRIVGACALLRMGADTLELAKMAVSPAAQGLGIGQRLAQAALDAARSMGARRVYLESNTGLTAAIGLYHKLGFRQIEPDRPSPYERVNIHMELLLDESPAAASTSLNS
ncbi:GNAT family N-acetyltransferase [Hymenobacter properus]|uniref:GNAT family N-acetyltransferase n=1 Tax=Hymenobacter properus TaxID=2791026 RepID=A0A931FJW6_9BACT|nr:GNAT family N-acetyltransferase [Hymenobacter properus]MBF9141015.1 GNAT family N-acetyltransferase [Hymenobacter properus]MBR7719824.1 GNAT family N-acetyltransferase [Microvirga sp. SRT04]